MYTVSILRSAQKSLAAINREDRNRIISALRLLATEPHPPGCKKLTDRTGWRIRVGAYRVIYEIYRDQLLILVVTIGHRREVYR